MFLTGVPVRQTANSSIFSIFSISFIFPILSLGCSSRFPLSPQFELDSGWIGWILGFFHIWRLEVIRLITNIKILPDSLGIRFWKFQVFYSQNHPLCISYYAGHFDMRNWGCLLIPKDVEFFCASFDVCHKFARGCPPTRTPTQKLKSGFLRFSSQEIGSSLISLWMIFEALQSELFRFKFHSLGSKILKFPEFNLTMSLKFALNRHFQQVK